MTKTVATQPTRNRKPATTHELLAVLTPELARAVPKGMDADRIARLVMTEVRKSRNAKQAGIARQSLEDCTHESFAGALLTASALGLEPGVNGECYLVPYRDNRRQVVECQLIIGYQGIVKLFWQHPRAARIDAQWVGENDEFTYSMGLSPTLHHIKAKGDRGKPTHFYAIVEVTGAQPLWDVFTAEEIRDLRRGKVGSSGDIKDPQRWMERKTALKQVLKLAPKTTRLDSAIKSDDRAGTDLARSEAMQLPPAVAQAPDYIDAEVEETSGRGGGDDQQQGAEPSSGAATPIAAGDQTPPVEVVMASKDQLAQLRQIRDAEKHDAASWTDFVHATIGRKPKSDKDLTAAEAAQVIDLFAEDGVS